ncbi:FliM/FliN family flagellar motor C-terminal domain-containing protein [Edaphobacter paludis]|uniref:FliM/FliN family flagellar motor C-terminal domain-containing protein n=1 Tax=Edaphobacter paludis TaxID=3035702 RepID=A0AAU7D182_9BACT
MTETGLMAHAAAASNAEVKPEANPEMPWMSRIEEHSSWPILSQLAVTMTVEIPLSRFKVQDLLGLKEGQIFQSASPDTEDVPLKIGDVQLGWTEFEVVEQKIALRLTRLV